MKFNIFILLVFGCLLVAVFSKLHKKEEKAAKPKKGKKAAPKKASKAAPKNTTASKGKGKKQGKGKGGGMDALLSQKTGPLILNSVGRKVYVKKSADIVLTKFPFEVTRCDQIVSFKGQFIPDLDEYRGRTDAWFTLTAHFANLFANDNAKHLLRSILLSETNIAPRTFHGSGGCIMIFSRKGGNNNISICLNDKKQQQNILDVLKTFNECRGGSNLKKLDALKIADMIKTCGGKGKFVNPFKLIKKLKKKKMKIHKDKNWFHPGFDGVPGTSDGKMRRRRRRRRR